MSETVIYNLISLWVNELGDKSSINKIDFNNSKLLVSGDYLIITEISDDGELASIFNLKNIIRYKTK